VIEQALAISVCRSVDLALMVHEVVAAWRPVETRLLKVLDSKGAILREPDGAGTVRGELHESDQ